MVKLGVDAATLLDEVYFNRSGSLVNRCSGRPAAFQHPETQQSVQVLFEPRRHQDVSHVTECIDNTSICDGRWVRVHQFALQANILPEQIPSYSLPGPLTRSIRVHTHLASFGNSAPLPDDLEGNRSRMRQVMCHDFLLSSLSLSWHDPCTYPSMDGEAKIIRPGKGLLMKLVASLAVTVAAALFCTSGAHASGLNGLTRSQTAHSSSTTFRVSVTGTAAKGTTFWVAHGPLNGRFGVIRLQHESGKTYTARVTLPNNETTSFTYLAAQGVQWVHGLPEPGGAVTVIRTLDSVTASAAAAQAVHWSVPLG